MKNQILLAILVLGMAGGFYACGDHEAHMAEVKEQIKAEMAEADAKQAEELKAVVQNFYDQLSTTPGEGSAAKAATYMIPDWPSTPTPPGGEKLEGFVQTLFMFHGMIPDLKWDVQEMLVIDNRVIVRSRATGTPNSPEGYFFGVPTDGSKSFDVQTIDVHTVEDGKIVRSYHCEDWAAGIAQVSPAPAGE